MARALIDSITSMGNGTVDTVTKSVGSLAGHLPGEWGAIAAVIIALPLVSIFLFPILRLAGVIFQSIAAIGSALMVCLASWCLLAVNYVTALSRALHPAPGTEGRMRWMASAIVAFGCYALLWKFGIPTWVLLGAAAAVFGTLLLRAKPERFSLSKASKAVGPTIRIGLVTAALVLIAMQLRPEATKSRSASSFDRNVNSCLVQGVVDSVCLLKSGAEGF